MIDFTIFYKKVILKKEDNNNFGEYDYFISALNDSFRVKEPFARIIAKNKIWIVFPHYGIDTKNNDLLGSIYSSDHRDESSYFLSFFEEYKIKETDKVCIDITGFIRPHLIFFLNLLQLRGFRKIDCIYSEPIAYANQEKTKFSKSIEIIKQIPGLYSLKNCSASKNDILIIGSGYDDFLIAKVANEKKLCRKFQIIGFPSLQIDMYQENLLRIEKAKENLGGDVQTFYAPANDPFVTAQIINEIVQKQSNKANIYLCPVSTKAQVLGFAIYYMHKFKSENLSILFPYSNGYSQKTSEGWSRTWLYEVEMP